MKIVKDRRPVCALRPELRRSELVTCLQSDFLPVLQSELPGWGLSVLLSNPAFELRFRSAATILETRSRYLQHHLLNPVNCFGDCILQCLFFPTSLRDHYGKYY